MMGLDFVIAAMLAGFGVYSVIATSRNDSTGGRGRGPCSDCSSSGCTDAQGDAPPPCGPRPLATGAECLSPANEPTRTLKQVSPVRVG